MKSYPRILSIVPYIAILLSMLVTGGEAFASAAQCKQKAEKLKKECDTKFKETQAAINAMPEEVHAEMDAAGLTQAINHGAGSMIAKSDDAIKALVDTEKHCKEKQDQCEQVCKPSAGKTPLEKNQIAEAMKDCKEKIEAKKKALKGAQGQNQQAKKGAEKTQAGSGEQKQQGGGEQKPPGGGAPPGGAPPGGAPPEAPKAAETPTPTSLPGSEQKKAEATPQECNDSSFGGTNPNCVPKAASGPATATTEDPLKKKCEGTTDNSPECLAYRGKKIGVASIPTAGFQAASTGGGGGGGSGSTASGTQAVLTPDIKIPDSQGTKEGLNAGVDSAGGFSGYGTASAGGSTLEDMPPLGGSRNTASAAGGGLAAMGLGVTDVARSHGPSVITIVSDVIRNRCNAGRFLHCEPRK